MLLQIAPKKQISAQCIDKWALRWPGAGSETLFERSTAKNVEFEQQLEDPTQGRCQGEERWKFPPPHKLKNSRRKMVLFTKALFFATNFRKKENRKIKNKKSNFPIEFSSKSFKIFSLFTNNLGFSSKHANT